MSDTPTGPDGKSPEDDIPANALAQVRELYADLVAYGVSPTEARDQVAFATLANGLTALCLALNEVVAGIPLPLHFRERDRVNRMIGHAHTASNLATRIANGAISMKAKDGD